MGTNQLCFGDFLPGSVMYSGSSPVLAVLPGGTVSVDSDSFDDNSNFQSFFGSEASSIQPSDIRWLFTVSEGSCITLVSGPLIPGGGDSNVVAFSADRLMVNISNVQIPSGGGTLFRVIQANSTLFVQSVVVLVRGKLAPLCGSSYDSCNSSFLPSFPTPSP